MSGYEQRLLAGLGRDLAARGIASWREDGAYGPQQIGVYLEDLPAKGDRAVALATYHVSDSPSLSDSVVGVQVLTREAGPDPRPGLDLADAIYDAWHGMHGVELATGVYVVQALRTSAVGNGQDGSRRWSRISNYYVTVHRPSTNRQ